MPRQKREEMEEVQTLDDAVERWTPGMLECRAANSHPWRRWTITHRPGAYTVFQRCPRCRNERYRTMSDRTGQWLDSHWSRTYRPGFLLKGLGRLNEDDRAMLRLRDIANAQVTEVTDT
jgi:hypothetical protein